MVIILFLIVSFLPNHQETAKAETEYLTTHPRLLFTSDELIELKQLKDTPSHQDIYNNIKSWADDHIGVSDDLRDELSEEPTVVVNALWLDIKNYICKMGFMYNMTDNSDYAEAGKALLLAVVGWSNWRNCEGCYWQGPAHMAYVTAVGYDLLYNYLTEGERESVRNGMFTHINAELYGYNEEFEEARFAQTFPNHICAISCGVGVAALALMGDVGYEDVANNWLDYAVQNAHRALSVYEKYGFIEGASYNDYGFSTLIPFLDALERVTGEDLFTDYPILTQVPDYFLNLIYNDRVLTMEDCSYAGYSSKYVFYLYKLASQYNNSYAQWLADSYCDQSIVESYIWKSPDIVATSPDDLPLNQYFEELGYVVFKSGWGSDDIRLIFKSGTSQGKGHASQNEFQIYYKGKPISCGPGYTSGDPVTDATWTSNCILVDELGQAQEPGDNESCPLDTRGVIQEFTDNSPYYAYARGDASATYTGENGAGDLDEWVRQVVYMEPNYFVMYDEVEASSASQFDWLFQLNNLIWEDLNVLIDESTSTITMTKIGGNYVDSSVKYVVNVIEPEDSAIEEVSVNTGWLGTDYSYIKVRPATNDTSARFLTVHFPLDIDGDALPSESLNIGNLSGVKVTNDDYIDLILFSQDGNPVSADIDYTTLGGDYFQVVGGGGGSYVFDGSNLNVQFDTYMVLRLKSVDSPVNNEPVINPVEDQTLVEGESLDFTLPGFDPDGDSVTYSYDSLPTGASLDPDTGEFSWIQSSGQAGTYNIQFEITDDNNLTDSEDIVIEVLAEDILVDFDSSIDPDGYTFIRDWTEVSASIDSRYQSSTYIDWDNSLVGYWNFNGESGTAANDSSTYSNHATLYNGTQWTTEGKFLDALELDGIDDYVMAPESASLLGISDEVTIEAWVKMPENADSGQLWLVGKNGTAAKQQVRIDALNSQITFTLNIDDLQNSLSAYFVFSPNIWHHVACTYDGSYMRIYCDGIPVARSSQITGTIETGGNAYIGMIPYMAPGQQFALEGNIDELRIWNRALSMEEMKASYNSKVSGFSNTFTDLANETHHYYIYTTDTAGNSVQTDIRSIIIASNIPLGDANDDNEVDILDFIKIKNIIFGDDVREPDKPGADVDQNCIVNTTDITLVERIIGGLSP